MANYITQDMSLPVVITGYRKVFPFAKFGHWNAVIVEVDVAQKATEFKPLPLDTFLVKDAKMQVDASLQNKNFLLIKETPPVAYGGGDNSVLRWTRKYANLPDSFERPVNINYTFPGVATGSSTSSTVITGRSYLNSNRMSLSAIAHPFNVEDVVRVYYSYDVTILHPGGRRTESRSNNAQAITKVLISDTNSFVIPAVYYRFRRENTLLRYQVSVFRAEKINVGRRVIPKPTIGYEVTDFYNTPDPATIERPAEFQLIDRTANEATDIINTNTEPDAATYFGWVNDKERLVARNLAPEQYGGNIWSTKTVYVIAE